jgi:hypothetical protein
MCWLSTASLKANEIREQGFSGAAMLPCSALEYVTVVKKMEKLEPEVKFHQSQVSMKGVSVG